MWKDIELRGKITPAFIDTITKEGNKKGIYYIKMLKNKKLILESEDFGDSIVINLNPIEFKALTEIFQKSRFR